MTIPTREREVLHTGATQEAGESASRFEPRKSCSSEASRLALAAAASAMGGGWLGGGGAARVRAGGGCAAATDGVGRCWQRSGRFFLSAAITCFPNLFPQRVAGCC